MVVGNDRVKFVSYTGKYPNLCSGVLTLSIDGEEIKFGHDYSISESWLKDDNYDSFWCSGGSCGFESGWSEYVNSGEWEIYKNDIPQKFRKYTDEITQVLNANVPHGCCGGCL